MFREKKAASPDSENQNQDWRVKSNGDCSQWNQSKLTPDGGWKI
jgi:hypothetical protein